MTAVPPLVSSMLLLVLGVGCAGSRDGDSPAPGAELAIRARLDSTTAGWNQGDLARYLSAYTDSVTSAGPSGFVTGKDAAADVMRSGFWRAGRPRQQLAYDHLLVRMLGADHALVTGRYVLTGADLPERTGWFTTVWLRTPDGWRMMHDHS